MWSSSCSTEHSSARIYHDMLTGARVIDLSPFACVASRGAEPRQSHGVLTSHADHDMESR
jgi:hypothetical protein